MQVAQGWGHEGELGGLAPKWVFSPPKAKLSTLSYHSSEKSCFEQADSQENH